jgi:hypothetical protein
MCLKIDCLYFRNEFRVRDSLLATRTVDEDDSDLLCRGLPSLGWITECLHYGGDASAGCQRRLHRTPRCESVHFALMLDTGWISFQCAWLVSSTNRPVISTWVPMGRSACLSLNVPHESRAAFEFLRIV